MARQGCSALHRAIRTVSGFRSTSVIPLVSVVHSAWSDATLGTVCGVNIRADTGPFPERASRSGGVGPTGLRIDGSHAGQVVGDVMPGLGLWDGARVGWFAPRSTPKGHRYGEGAGARHHREILDTYTPLAAGSGGEQPLRGLTGDRGDELEVLVHVQNGVAGAFGGSGDEQVGYAGSTVLTQVGELPLDLDRPLFHRRGEVLDQQRRHRW